MADTSIDPMMQHLDGLIHILMAMPGPRERAYLGKRITASQMKEAIKNKNAHTDSLASPTIDAMVDFLTANRSEWLHMVMLDVNMEDVGAYVMQDEERVRGIRQGKLHLAD